MVSSPLGLINLLDVGVCAALCWVKGGQPLLYACRTAKFLTKALDVVDLVVGMVKSRPDITSSPYCSMVKDTLKEKKKEQAKAPVTSTSSLAPSSAPTSSTTSSALTSSSSTPSKSSSPSTTSGGSTKK